MCARHQATSIRCSRVFAHYSCHRDAGVLPANQCRRFKCYRLVYVVAMPLLVASTGFRGTAVSRLFENRALAYIGRISYSIYLWQELMDRNAGFRTGSPGAGGVLSVSFETFEKRMIASAGACRIERAALSGRRSRADSRRAGPLRRPSPPAPPTDEQRLADDQRDGFQPTFARSPSEIIVEAGARTGHHRDASCSAAVTAGGILRTPVAPPARLPGHQAAAVARTIVRRPCRRGTRTG